MSVPRSYLYSLDCPEGRIFEGAEAIAAAVEDGWVDSPANIVQPETPAPKAKGGKGKPPSDDSQ